MRRPSSLRDFGLLAACLLGTILLSWADSAGPRSGTGAGTGWTAPTNVAAYDNSYATASLGPAALSNPLYVSGFGFTLPGGATVNGIVVTLERKCSANNSCNFDAAAGAGVWLTKTAGVAAGAAKSDANNWGNSDATVTFGANTDLWGLTWTADEINAAGFGALLKAYNSSGFTRTASLDYLAVTVYYTPGAASSGRRAVYSQTRTWPKEPRS